MKDRLTSIGLIGLFVILVLAASTRLFERRSARDQTWVGGISHIGDWFVGTNWSPSGCVPTET